PGGSLSRRAAAGRSPAALRRQQSSSARRPRRPESRLDRMTDVAQTFAATFVDELAAQGVEFACVSPGSRSAPIAMALQRHPRIKVLVHIDERCGSFFAVGLGKATGKPAVVLSTSGTAAAEFHAAVVEASYSRTPLTV